MPENTVVARTLRVTRGAASEEELAALLTALGLRGAAMRAAPPAGGPVARPLARWRRPERDAYTDPRAWQ